MCGRYGFYKDHVDEKSEAILTMLEKLYPDTEYKTGEIFPGDTAPGVIQDKGRIVPVPAVFGFPGFREGRLIINARCETAAEKRTFADSLKDRRIVLPANGFYEWDHTPQNNKYYFTVDGMETIYLCGIYRVVDGLYRFVILTREANASMKETHDRMPVIVNAEAVRPYLTDRRFAMEILSGNGPILTRQTA